MLEGRTFKNESAGTWGYHQFLALLSETYKQVWKQSWGTYPQGWWRPDRQENLSLTTSKLAEFGEKYTFCCIDLLRRKSEQAMCLDGNVTESKEHRL